MDFKEFSKSYIKELTQLLHNLDLNEFEKLKSLLEIIEGRIYIIGNGGSSATASHMANDLAFGLKRRGGKVLDAISLSNNSAINFAISNDIGFENVFSIQLENILKKEDVLIAISCSGNSPNILNAVRYAKEVGSTVVGLSGFEGGELKRLSDISIHVPTAKDEYGIVEDIHTIINHIIYTYFQKGIDENN